MTDATRFAIAPVIEEEETGPQPGTGLGVSGGGYRAMLFHLGAFLRLHELGLLKKLNRISSVSGGSITAAKIALEWGKLNDRADFITHVVEPIRHVASTTIDVPSVIWGLILPGGVAKQIAKRYRRYLFGDATLQDLPDDIRFVINATNLETGKLWRFSKPYMRDFSVGMVLNPKVSLADAVAASSGFPPVLAPCILKVKPSDFSHVEPGVPQDMLSDISLADGGVYDNLGLETVWKRYQTVLVSDAGVAVGRNADVPGDWARLGIRAVDIIYGQVASVRTRQVIASFIDEERTGAYWGVRSNIASYGLPDTLPCPFDRTTELAATATRLCAFSGELQERLINWGYAVCDAAVRKHWLPANNPPAAFPYPGTGV
jgi:NTE family protein